MWRFLVASLADILREGRARRKLLSFNSAKVECVSFLFVRGFVFALIWWVYRDTILVRLFIDRCLVGSLARAQEARRAGRTWGETPREVWSGP